MAVVPFSELQDVIASAFLRAGISEEDARRCARIHAESTLDGVNSHGVNRVARFVDYVGRAWVSLEVKPERVKELGAIEIYDGARGLGVLNALFATDRAMEMASGQGVGIVALRNTTHWMRGGTYGWRAADQGYLAICWTNTESCMPAWGASDTRLGNNPLVMAVPRAKGHLVLDMAMSQYSYGKLQTTRLKGHKLPFPGGFDTEGNLTDEPGPIEASMRILPTGYWKGSGLAMMLDVLAAVLSEGLATHAMDQLQRGSCTGCSQVFVLIDPAHLGGEAFTEQIANSVVEYVHGSTPAESGARVLYPGENALATRKRQLEKGVFVDDGVWSEVQRLATGKS